jgi:tRNA nucleotidyltransferase (CCA-adding enzyme)
MIKAFKQALPILKQIEDSGYEAYFVGGSVRDYLLSKDIDDVDIATSATPDEIKKIFPKTVDVGIEHGTVLVLFNGHSYEVTTFRTESEYEDFRRPKNVQFIRSLNEDLRRRDFTMNAIAMDRHGKLIDPFHGFVDIQNKNIQTVGSAEERFSEDALRMMRALRFVSQLSFSIEDKTFESLKRNVSLLDYISVERKTKEFEKLLCGKNRKRALKLLTESGLQKYLSGLTKAEAGLKRLSEFECSNLDIAEMWVLLVYCLEIEPNEIVAFLRDWRLPNQKMKEIEKITRYLLHRTEFDWDEVLIYQAGENISVKVETIYNVLKGYTLNTNIELLRCKYISLPIKGRNEVAVTGEDLLAWEAKAAGPWIKERLEMIERAILLGKLNNEKEAIREWLIHCNPKSEKNY